MSRNSKNTGLLAFGLVMNRPSDPVEVTKPKPVVQAKPLVAVAEVIQTHRAVWSGSVMGRLSAGPHRLESGRATLKFPDGTQLVLQGPCAFELTAHTLRVQEGVVLLRSGRAGEERPGFRFVLETPNLRLRDLGTEAGVSVASGTSRVTVFRGQVMATVAANHVGMAQELKLTRDDGVEVTAEGLVISGIVADAGIFETMRQGKPRLLVANASFEYPKAEGGAALAASGWKLLSHPVANANPMDLGAGVFHAGLSAGANQKSPRPSDGTQWAYLSAKTTKSGRTAYASMHQEVGEVEHATTYRLRMTMGWPQNLPAASFTVGLYAGTRRPTNALSVWRDPVKPVAGRVAEVDLSYHAPLHSAYRGQKLYLVIEAVPGTTVGVRRVLVDNVRLQMVEEKP